MAHIQRAEERMSGKEQMNVGQESVGRAGAKNG